MSLLGKIFGSGDSEDSDNGYGTSDYDGRPLNKYGITADDGRQVTVYSSWRRGDPER